MAKVYIAGPDVFFPNKDEIFNKLSDLCRERGFIPVVPLQNQDAIPTDLTPFELGKWIARACYSILAECDFVLAIVSPFRHVSADVETCVEIGIAVALEKPVYAYTNNTDKLQDKIRNSGVKLRRFPNGSFHDESGNWIEEFDMPDNCMIHGLVTGTYPDAKSTLDQLRDDYQGKKASKESDRHSVTRQHGDGRL